MQSVKPCLVIVKLNIKRNLLFVPLPIPTIELPILLDMQLEPLSPEYFDFDSLLSMNNDLI